MKKTQLIMGMPITIEIIGRVRSSTLDQIFDYFRSVDKRFSTYKSNSEVSKINHGLHKNLWSPEATKIMKLAAQTKKETSGYFDIEKDGQLDPSGIVKGWSINEAAKQLKELGYKDFYVEAGGDVQVSGQDSDSHTWSIGIRNPFNVNEIIKVLHLTNKGVATSGNYVRGQHVYNPHKPRTELNEVTSLTVIGPNVYEADRFATAAFAMGEAGIDFIEKLKGFEGYMITANKLATYTSGFMGYA